MDMLTHSVVWLLVFVLLYTLRKKSRHSFDNNGLLPPEVPGAWPIIGHIHLLGDKIPLQRILGAIAEKYGPIYTIWLGMHRTVVISDREAVRECFTTHDKVLAGRPASSAGEHLGYNNAGFGFLSYGPYWRKIRKIVLSEVLSARRLEKFSHARVSEVEMSIGELYSTVITNQSEATMIASGGNNNTPVMINIGHWIEKVTLNLMVKMITGKRYRTDGFEDDEARRSRKAIVDFLTASGQSVLSDVIPFRLLKWIDINGTIKSMKRIAAEMDGVISSWIDEHAKRKSENERDFIDVLTSLVTDDLEHGHSRHTIIKATIATIIVAGSDSPSLNLTWALSLLINNKDVMLKAQKEIDTNVGVERWVEESDIKHLVYLQAIVKETLRLYPPAPLAVPHAAMEDCDDVVGYRIPKGTRVLLNLWKLQRDPDVWSDPEKFCPDRFLSGEVDFLDQNFGYIPFGSGRRSCPGIGFAMQVSQLVLARLIQGFDFSAPSDMAVDMTEGVSFSLPKAKALEVLVTPRLPSVLYGS